MVIVNRCKQNHIYFLYIFLKEILTSPINILWTDETKQNKEDKRMNNIKRIPASNSSSQVAFLLRGASKRRSIAMAKAKMVQGDQGITPRLVAVK